MAITLAQATAQLSLWMDADASVATGQSYTINGRSLTRANASEITDKIQYWSSVESKLQRIANGQTGTGVSLARFDL